MNLRKDRKISLAILVGYLVGYVFLAFAQQQVPFRAGPAAAGGIAITVFLLLILALIWFGDEMGEYIGPLGRGYINQKSPGWLVKLIGWMFLLAAGAPLAISVYSRLVAS
jgi:hypothetical protein